MKMYSRFPSIISNDCDPIILSGKTKATAACIRFSSALVKFISLIRMFRGSVVVIHLSVVFTHTPNDLAS